MKDNIGKVAVEILTIIDLFESNLKEKIPKSFIENLNQAKSEDYIFNYDYSKTLDEQNILPETKGFIAYIYSNFICNENQKKEFFDIYHKRQYELEMEKKKKFEQKNAFSNSNKVQFSNFNDNFMDSNISYSGVVSENATNLPALRGVSFFYILIKRIKEFFRKV